MDNNIIESLSHMQGTPKKQKEIRKLIRRIIEKYQPEKIILAIEYDSNLEKYREALQFTTEFYIEDRYPYFGSGVPSKDEFEVYMIKVFELIQLLMGMNR